MACIRHSLKAACGLVGFALSLGAVFGGNAKKPTTLSVDLAAVATPPAHCLVGDFTVPDFTNATCEWQYASFPAETLVVSVGQTAPPSPPPPPPPHFSAAWALLVQIWGWFASHFDLDLMPELLLCVAALLLHRRLPAVDPSSRDIDTRGEEPPPIVAANTIDDAAPTALFTELSAQLTRGEEPAAVDAATPQPMEMSQDMSNPADTASDTIATVAAPEAPQVTEELEVIDIATPVAAPATPQVTEELSEPTGTSPGTVATVAAPEAPQVTEELEDIDTATPVAAPATPQVTEELSEPTGTSPGTAATVGTPAAPQVTEEPKEIDTAAPIAAPAAPQVTEEPKEISEPAGTSSDTAATVAAPAAPQVTEEHKDIDTAATVAAPAEPPLLESQGPAAPPTSVEAKPLELEEDLAASMLEEIAALRAQLPNLLVQHHMQPSLLAANAQCLPGPRNHRGGLIARPTGAGESKLMRDAKKYTMMQQGRAKAADGPAHWFGGAAYWAAKNRANANHRRDMTSVEYGLGLELMKNAAFATAAQALESVVARAKAHGVQVPPPQ